MPLLKDDHYTIEDIYALPEGKRAELIDGQIYDMAPPSYQHQRLVMELSSTLRNYIKSKGGPCEVLPAPFAVFLNQDDYNYVEPDISVICDPSKINDKGCNGAPDFIIEIVSPSSQRMDYLTKLFKYRTAGVREYWIVNPLKQTIQVYSFEGTEDSTQYSFDDEVTVTIYGDLKICIAGDITHSRVAKSNMQILKRLGAQLYFAGPAEWYSNEFDVYGQHVAIDDVIEDLDVLMLLRVQHERHGDDKGFSKEDYHALYGLTEERYAKLADQAIIMHPAPVNRDVEIADSLVEAPKARIVAQMQNGVFVRMAIIEAILNGKA